MLALEKHAEQVARDVMPNEPTSGERSGDFVAILTALMAVLPQLLQLCPQSADAKRDALRKPSMGQRAMFLKQLRETCACCGMFSNVQVGSVYRYAVARGSMLSESEAAQIVEETNDDQNLLI